MECDVSIDCEWIIERLEGTKLTRRTTEAQLPKAGQGKVIDGIPCRVNRQMPRKFSSPQITHT